MQCGLIGKTVVVTRPPRGLGARHDERRAEIVEALLRIVGSRGVEATSLREVADEAGVSMGRVQHYFRTKDEMLRFAFERITERSAERVGTRLAREGPDPTPRTVLRGIAVEMLPTTENGLAELRIGTAFATRALVEPALGERLRAGYRELADLVTVLLARARERNELASGVDVDIEASTFFALIDGLGNHVVIGHLGAEAAVDAVDAYLGRIFA